ncbi:MAG: 4Fe-4S binding protein [Candidatus Micrarchaeia archaeon]
MEELEGLLPIAKPKVGSAGKTGTWRVEKPVIDFEACKKCDICILECVENTIDKGSNGYPNIDYNYCKGCGVCSNVCPVKAIKMVGEVRV